MKLEHDPQGLDARRLQDLAAEAYTVYLGGHGGALIWGGASPGNGRRRPPDVEDGKQTIAGGRTWPVRVKRAGERRSLSRSATRALDLLEYFGQIRRPLRAVEISSVLDLHASTTNQLLKTMVGSAHLIFDARTKTYLPSHRLAGFGAWIIESYGGDAGLRAMVCDVQSQTGEIVTLTTPNDLFMQIIDFASPDPLGQPAERGLRVSVFGSAVGAAYLATLTDEDLARLAARARLPAAEADEVLVSAGRTRRDGFAEGPTSDAAVWSLAAALPSQGLHIPLVLGLAGPAGRVQSRRAQLQAVMSAAIAHWLAWRPPDPDTP